MKNKREKLVVKMRFRSVINRFFSAGRNIDEASDVLISLGDDISINPFKPYQDRKGGFSRIARDLFQVLEGIGNLVLFAFRLITLPIRAPIIWGIEKRAQRKPIDESSILIKKKVNTLAATFALDILETFCRAARGIALVAFSVLTLLYLPSRLLSSAIRGLVKKPELREDSFGQEATSKTSLYALDVLRDEMDKSTKLSPKSSSIDAKDSDITENLEVIKLLHNLYRVVSGKTIEEPISFGDLKIHLNKHRTNSPSEKQLFLLGEKIATSAAIIARTSNKLAPAEIDIARRIFYQSMEKLYGVQMWLEDKNLANIVSQEVIGKSNWSQMIEAIGTRLENLQSDVIGYIGQYLSPYDIQSLQQTSTFFRRDRSLKCAYGPNKPVPFTATGYCTMYINDGILYGMGKPSRDGLIVLNGVHTDMPHEIDGFNGKKAHQIISGYKQSFVICDDGLYQLGVKIFYDSNMVTSRAGPMIVKIPMFADKKVQKVVSGGEYTLVLCSDGLYGMGSNIAGQLGLEGDMKRTAFTKIDKFKGKKIHDLAVGHAHSLILCDDGLYGMGANHQKQLGLKCNEGQFIPVKIPGFKGKKIRQLIATHSQSLVLCEDGLYGMGLNDHNQLQEGAARIIRKATKIHKFNDKQIIKVVAGFDHTLVLCNDGIYVMGSNSCGQLGLGDIKTQRSPIKHPAFNDKRIIQVIAGEYSTFIVCSDGIYAMGLNNHGNLGLGAIYYQMVPIRLAGSLDIWPQTSEVVRKLEVLKNSLPGDEKLIDAIINECREAVNSNALTITLSNHAANNSPNSELTNCLYEQIEILNSNQKRQTKGK